MKKKTIKKTRAKVVKVVRDSVTVKMGPLAGMEFTVDTVLLIVEGQETIQYSAPNKGPACVITHRDLKDAAKAEDVRLAFSKFFPPSIVYRGGEYWDTINDRLLEWNKHQARFVYMAIPADQAEDL